AEDPRPQLADLRRGRSDLRPEQHEFPGRSGPVPALRQDGRVGRVARLLPRLRADEGQNRLDAGQDLSPGSGARLGFPDRGGREPSRPAGSTFSWNPAGLAPRPRRGRSDWRDAPVILEGIVTTLSPEGRLNIAPMGPKLGDDLRLERFEL